MMRAIDNTVVSHYPTLRASDLFTLEDGGLEAKNGGGEIEVAVAAAFRSGSEGLPELPLVEVRKRLLDGVSEETLNRNQRPLVSLQIVPAFVETTR